MSTVQLKAALTLHPATPPPPALVVTPATVTLPDATVGVATPVATVAQVSGGKAPYSYALDPTSDQPPDGMGFSEDGNGNIAWGGTPTDTTITADKTYNLLLNVTDSAGASAQMKAIAPVAA